MGAASSCAALRKILCQADEPLPGYRSPTLRTVPPACCSRLTMPSCIRPTNCELLPKALLASCCPRLAADMPPDASVKLL